MARYSDGLKDRIWSEGFTHIFNSGAYLEFYTGIIPGNPNLAHTGMLLIRTILPDCPFKATDPKIVDVNTTWQSLYGDVINTGQVTWGRIRRVNDPNTLDLAKLWPRIDFSVGIDAPAELVLDTVDVDSNTIIRISNFTLIADVLLTIPTIEVQPLNFNAIPGESVTFTIVASGLLPIHYQWQRDSGSGWINTGFNSTTLNITQVELTDNQSRFRVVVSNESGSILSDTVSLLVSATREMLRPAMITTTESTTELSTYTTTPPPTTIQKIEDRYPARISPPGSWPKPTADFVYYKSVSAEFNVLNVPQSVYDATTWEWTIPDATGGISISNVTTNTANVRYAKGDSGRSFTLSCKITLYGQTQLALTQCTIG